jgi:hypothetical protein
LRPVGRNNYLSNLFYAIHPPAQFFNPVLANNSYLIFITVVVRHVFSPQRWIDSDSIFDSFIFRKSNRLRLMLSVQKESAVCSKRNTSITAWVDSSLLSTQPLVLAPESAEAIQQIQNHADPCQVHSCIAPQSQDHLHPRNSGRIKERFHCYFQTGYRSSAIHH